MSRSQHTTRRPLLAGSALLLIGLATACSSEPGTSASSESSSSPAATASSTAGAETAESAAPSDSAAAPAPTSGEESSGATTEQASADCGVNPQAEAIHNNISQVPPPQLPDSYWQYNGESNYDPCADLSYASIDQMPQGNAQFARQIMMFHKGEYIGVGSDRVLQHIDILNVTDDSFTARYKDWVALEEAGGANAEAPKYTKDVTYRWNGEGVEMIGTVPGQ